MMGRKAPFVLCCQQLKKLKLLLYQNPIKASNNLPALINTARTSVCVQTCKVRGLGETWKNCMLILTAPCVNHGNITFIFLSSSHWVYQFCQNAALAV